MKRTSFFILFLIIGCWAQAQDVKQWIADAPDASAYPNAATLTLFDSTTVDMEDSGLSRYYTHKLIKVLTRDGAKQQRVQVVGYDPLSAYVEIRLIKVYKTDGSEHIISSPVLDYAAPARMIYWGAREKMQEVGRLEIGDVVEIKTFKKGFTYALLQGDDERYIPPMRGHFYDIVPFWSTQPIMQKVYSLRLPAHKQLQYKVYNGKMEVDSSKDKDFQYFTFVKNDIMPAKSEPQMVSQNNVQLKLLLSTSPDWEAKSRWFCGVNEDYDAFTPTPEVQAFVNKLLLPATTEEDSISILTHWVADNMRYSGISMGKGEGFTLHNAKMNFTDRCGVCKDKASLLISMLRAAGFESYAAMTMAGERIEDIPADQFNHSVTVVKRHSGEWQVLDPTWVPGVRELWSSAEQQQGYLMGLPQGADLKYTPVSAPENHYVRLTGVSELHADGTLKGHFTITAEGQSDASVRGVFRYYKRSLWKQSLEKELLKIHPAAKLIDVVHTDNDKYLEAPVSITYTYEIPEYAFVSDNEIIFTPVLAQEVFKRAMSHLYANTAAESKTYGFKDRCSRLVEVSETVKLPEYKSVVSMPQVEPVQAPHVSFEAAYKLKGNTLQWNEYIKLGKRVYDAQDWPSYRQAVVNQKYMASHPIIISLNK